MAASVHLGNGDGSFSGPQTYEIESIGGNQVFTLALADVNGDQLLDMVTANVSSQQLSILLGNGDGTFKARYTLPAIDYIWSASASDLNQDGITDLISTNTNLDSISVFIGNGNGSFQVSQSYTTSDYPTSTTVFDLNKDGVKDIVSTNLFSNDISVLLGNGNGSFKAPTQYSTDLEPHKAVIGDFNGDGKDDLLVASRQQSTSISLLLGNGDGTFLAYTSTPISYEAWGALAVDDLNNDGALDFVIDTERVFFGNTRDGIGPQTSFSLNTRSDALAAMSQFAGNLDRLSQQRATIGAFQSRLSSAIATLQTTKENYAAAESRIKDTDVAFESSQGLRANILQQVAAAVLAQANQQPTIALQLLRS